MKRLVLATIALTASAASWAQFGGYVGGNLGLAMASTNCGVSGLNEGCNIDKNSTGWKLYSGFRFNPIVGAEVIYFNFGKAKWSGTLAVDDTAVSGESKASGYGIGPSFHFDLTPQWSTDFRVGYSHLKVSNGYTDAQKNAAYVGIDAGYLVAKGVRLHAAWDFATAMQPVSESDVHLNLFSLGASYSF